MTSVDERSNLTRLQHSIVPGLSDDKAPGRADVMSGVRPRCRVALYCEMRNPMKSTTVLCP